MKFTHFYCLLPKIANTTILMREGFNNYVAIVITHLFLARILFISI